MLRRLAAGSTQNQRVADVVFVPWIFPKTDWLMRFVARLLDLKPELTPAAAVMVAIEAFDKSPEVDPIKAAEIYVDGTGKE